jgi:hypothetical protein
MPGVCLRLKETVERLFPIKSAQRRAEVEAQRRAEVQAEAQRQKDRASGECSSREQHRLDRQQTNAARAPHALSTRTRLTYAPRAPAPASQAPGCPGPTLTTSTGCLEHLSAAALQQPRDSQAVRRRRPRLQLLAVVVKATASCAACYSLGGGSLRSTSSSPRAAAGLKQQVGQQQHVNVKGQQQQQRAARAAQRQRWAQRATLTRICRTCSATQMLSHQPWHLVRVRAATWRSGWRARHSMRRSSICRCCSHCRWCSSTIGSCTHSICRLCSCCSYSSSGRPASCAMMACTHQRRRRAGARTHQREPAQQRAVPARLQRGTHHQHRLQQQAAAQLPGARHCPRQQPQAVTARTTCGWRCLVRERQGHGCRVAQQQQQARCAAAVPQLVRRATQLHHQRRLQRRQQAGVVMLLTAQGPQTQWCSTQAAPGTVVMLGGRAPSACACSRPRGGRLTCTRWLTPARQHRGPCS